MESRGGGEKLEVGPVTDILQRQDVIHRSKVRVDEDTPRDGVVSIENSVVSTRTLGVIVEVEADSDHVVVPILSSSHPRSAE